jgi:hypothetical protein
MAFTRRGLAGRLQRGGFLPRRRSYRVTDSEGSIDRSYGDAPALTCFFYVPMQKLLASTRNLIKLINQRLGGRRGGLSAFHDVLRADRFAIHSFVGIFVGVH